MSSLLGPWTVIACDNGLHSVKLSEEVTNENFLELGCQTIQILKPSPVNQQIEQFKEWMIAYFDDNRKFNHAENRSATPYICTHVLPPKDGENSMTFRQNVWTVLKEQIGFGETISYGGLARLCCDSGKISAAQAVGGAMANNPISLIVPCHRVVKADGNAGNYSKCTKNNIKIWLLNHETSKH